jgi:hypothetical protein
MIKDHHESYITWDEFERNQKQLALNNYGRAGGVKTGRGGRALLSGIMTCGRCGRRLSVAYTGNPQSRPVYRCDKPNLMMGLPRCMTFGGPRVDAAIASELLRAVEPMAIEAAFRAERMYREQEEDQQRILDLELQQARYEANLAERRYAACDPDNRLIAAQLEKNWEIALRRVRNLEERRPAAKKAEIAVDPNAFANLAENLAEAWNAPGVTMRARQQLLRALIVDIIVDVDEEARDVVLTIHWRGGQHSELRVRKPRTENMAARRPKMRWRSCAAWPVAGQTSISPHRSIGWACLPVRARLGRLIASLQFAACAVSMPTDLRKRMANG